MKHGWGIPHPCPSVSLRGPKTSAPPRSTRCRPPPRRPARAQLHPRAEFHRPRQRHPPAAAPPPAHAAKPPPPSAPTPAVTAQARNNAKDVLARTTQSVQAVQAMQAAARAAALAGPNHLGPNPNQPGQLLPVVPNGLTPRRPPGRPRRPRQPRQHPARRKRRPLDRRQPSHPNHRQRPHPRHRQANHRPSGAELADPQRRQTNHPQIRPVRRRHQQKPVDRLQQDHRPPPAPPPRSLGPSKATARPTSSTRTASSSAAPPRSTSTPSPPPPSPSTTTSSNAACLITPTPSSSSPRCRSPAARKVRRQPLLHLLRSRWMAELAMSWCKRARRSPARPTRKKLADASPSSVRMSATKVASPRRTARTILAAGLQVGFAAHAGSDASSARSGYLRRCVLDPNMVNPPTAGTAANLGLISAPRANVTMIGKTVQQISVIR